MDECYFLSGYNQRGIKYHVTFEECEAFCCADSLCRSFDYRRGGNRVCALSSSIKDEVGSAFTTRGCGEGYQDYYEKIGKT